MNRFERSWLLFKSSMTVIGKNKELLIFPILTTISSIVILLFFFVPAALWPTAHPYTTVEHWKELPQVFFTKTADATSAHNVHFSPVAAGYLVFLYFISMFLATFFNVAFYHEIIAALNGEAVSIGRGLQFACTRWQAILMWTIFAGIVGLIIKAIEERLNNVVGEIFMRLIGAAWSIASVFVIPVIVREEQTVNPFAMLRKSASTLKQMWGESLIGYVGLGMISSIAVIGSALGLGAAIFVSNQLHSFALLALSIVGWIVLMLVWSYLMNVANMVYKGALYLYAAEGIVSEPYDQDLLNSAWRFKRVR